MGQTPSTRSHAACEGDCRLGGTGRCVYKSNIDVSEDAVQAGSVLIKLIPPPSSTTSLDPTTPPQSSAAPRRLLAWTDILDPSLIDISQLIAPESSESSPVFESLVYLSKTRIGSKPHEFSPIYAYCKSYKDSLAVRVYLTPWGGRFQGLKPVVWRHLERVLMQLVNRWEWQDFGRLQGEPARIFENKVCRVGGI